MREYLTYYFEFLSSCADGKHGRGHARGRSSQKFSSAKDRRASEDQFARLSGVQVRRVGEVLGIRADTGVSCHC